MFGIDCGVRIGLIRGAKDGDGLVRRYIEMRERMSTANQQTKSSQGVLGQPTLVVRVQKVIVCVSKSKLVSHWRDLVASVEVLPQVAVGKRFKEVPL